MCSVKLVQEQQDGKAGRQTNTDGKLMGTCVKCYSLIRVLCSDSWSTDVHFIENVSKHKTLARYNFDILQSYTA